MIIDKGLVTSISRMMFEICLTIIWLSCSVKAYPTNTTLMISNGVGFIQKGPTNTLIVPIVVSVVAIMLIIVIIAFLFIRQNGGYGKIEDTENLSGLGNSDETCYMNSMIQAVASCNSLIYEYDGLNKKYCDDLKFSKLEMFVTLLNGINSTVNKTENIKKNTDRLKKLMQEVKWNLPSQQDSFQCLSAFINGIQHDFNDILKKEKITMPPKFKLLHAFTESASFNKVQDHLALAVPLCGKFRGKPGVRLEDLIDAFFSPSDIDDGIHKTQMFFYKIAPKILFLHIQANEWDPDNNEYIKPTYYIQYQERMKYICKVQMEPDGSQLKEIETEYRLLSVVHHMGSVKGGHYIAYRKHAGDWWLTNDEQVERLNSLPDAIVPYIMVYERI